ncbi:hypothetical protein B0H19DRAFT_1385192 [Mycena capillaripes]|nr:hypothetical protein B0H19DRAFT_1385192 [Mycena capillaripes]
MANDISARLELMAADQQRILRRFNAWQALAPGPALLRHPRLQLHTRALVRAVPAPLPLVALVAPSVHSAQSRLLLLQVILSLRGLGLSSGLPSLCQRRAGCLNHSSRIFIAAVAPAATALNAGVAHASFAWAASSASPVGIPVALRLTIVAREKIAIPR